MFCIWFNFYFLIIKFFDIFYLYIFLLIMLRCNLDIVFKFGVIILFFILFFNKFKKIKYFENMYFLLIIFFFLFLCFMVY